MMEHGLKHPTLSETEALIKTLYQNELDKSGNKKYSHPIAVKNRLLLIYPSASEGMQHTALLHDTIEDGHATKESLKKRGYSDEIIKNVDALSKPFKRKEKSDGTHYLQWIQSLIESQSPEVMLIKLADIVENSSHERMNNLNRAEQLYRQRKYSEPKFLLAQALSEMGYTSPVIEKSTQAGVSIS